MKIIYLYVVGATQTDLTNQQIYDAFPYLEKNILIKLIADSRRATIYEVKNSTLILNNLLDQVAKKELLINDKLISSLPTILANFPESLDTEQDLCFFERKYEKIEIQIEAAHLTSKKQQNITENKTNFLIGALGSIASASLGYLIWLAKRRWHRQQIKPTISPYNLTAAAPLLNTAETKIAPIIEDNNDYCYKNLPKADLKLINFKDCCNNQSLLLLDLAIRKKTGEHYDNVQNKNIFPQVIYQKKLQSSFFTFKKSMENALEKGWLKTKNSL